LFGRYGFRKASMDEIARSADISRQGEGIGLERRVVAALDARLAAAIAAATSEADRRRLGVTPEEIAGALHMVAQGAKYLSEARAESRAEFVARVTAAGHVVFAGFGNAAKRTP